MIYWYPSSSRLKMKAEKQDGVEQYFFRELIYVGLCTRVILSLWVLHNSNNNISLTAMKISAYLNVYLLNFLTVLLMPIKHKCTLTAIGMLLVLLFQLVAQDK